MPLLSLQDVHRSFGVAHALDGLSLDVDEGQILAILGPSGSGKSTLLRLIAGLENADSGRILFDGRDMAGVPPHTRGFGLMFQDYCLFPHLGVQQNVEFGLRMQHMGADKRRQRAAEVLRLVRMADFAGRDVHTLSGGEQQRVALARGCAPAPRLLMLDEPLGALDASLRVSLLAELGDILREVGVTVIYVTHDHAEAMTIATRIALVDAGKVLQAGSPDNLIRTPASARVASFLRLGALVPGHLRFTDGAPRIATPIGVIAVPRRLRPDAKVEESGVLLVRAAACSLEPTRDKVETRARLISRLVHPQGSTLRIGIIGNAGNEYAMDVNVATAGGAESAWDPGKVRPVWIDPNLCEVLPAEN